LSGLHDLASRRFALLSDIEHRAMMATVAAAARRQGWRRDGEQDRSDQREAEHSQQQQCERATHPKKCLEL
jgi:hypothetical protein